MSRFVEEPKAPSHLVNQQALVITATGKEFKCKITSVSPKAMWLVDTETGNTCSLALKIWDDHNHQSDVVGRNIRLPYWVVLIWKKPIKNA